MINELSKEIHLNNVEKGFYEKPVPTAVRIALIHSEASEALESDRKGMFCTSVNWKSALQYSSDEIFKEVFESEVKDTFEDELADIMIRVMDLAFNESIDLETHIKAKMRYNSLRPYKHSKRY